MWRLRADGAREEMIERRALRLIDAANAWLGWWWADPVAALVMVPFIVREGLEAVRGRTCCAG